MNNNSSSSSNENKGGGNSSSRRRLIIDDSFSADPSMTAAAATSPAAAPLAPTPPAAHDASSSKTNDPAYYALSVVQFQGILFFEVSVSMRVCSLAALKEQQHRIQNLNERLAAAESNLLIVVQVSLSVHVV
jgi:hypothetical protein